MLKKLKQIFDDRVTRYLCRLGFAHYRRYFIYGPGDRLHWEKTGKEETINAIFNTRSGHITIGADAVIGHNCMFLTGRHEFENGQLVQPRSRQVPDSGYNIRIGLGCWLASGVTVVGGVTLGDHCIVCAGGVVTKSFGDHCILAGVPAQVIGNVNELKPREDAK